MSDEESDTASVTENTSLLRSLLKSMEYFKAQQSTDDQLKFQEGKRSGSPPLGKSSRKPTK